jgi:hypothetical protein
VVVRFKSHELDVEDQASIGGNSRRIAALTIGQVRRDLQATLLADTHAQETLIPALDDCARSESEGEGSTALETSVEFSAVFELTLSLHRIRIDDVNRLQPNLNNHKKNS